MVLVLVYDIIRLWKMILGGHGKKCGNRVIYTHCVMYCVEVLTSGAQAKTKLTAHFDCYVLC